ncbi:protein of unknown function DUF6 transmembrane [Deinococcus proteolyticus MRP]|uniref:EamA domain-containing protein n=1 Tax=Deinococcus proteolyticus (strain ATCC 35074 / DSM 20540 / JCM 6276 / NBRC 101906 / NCIMB 13154 / VKM Ac-1939 / CCM 2703 / MRP) TaxID=693977 RepID=F0RN99_DEIPM|nr:MULTISPECIES: DMT family transporter [Deinococcus]ADY26241.1 protein of unknown function DUF6 transmembrane [Deinococcus proteolyticus MRP]MCY1702358.1 DMT family transporter [Deinococcus sp. SL84]
MTATPSGTHATPSLPATSALRGAALLGLVTLIWGSTFAVIKTLGAQLDPAAMVAWRFTVAAAVLAPATLWQIQRRRRKYAARRPWTAALWRDAAILSAWLLASYGTQTVALQTTTANRTAFFTALSVLLVPLWLAAVQGRRLPAAVWLALPLALGGLGLLSWEGGALNVGDAWAVGCAVTYAGFIIALEGMAGRYPALPFTLAQVVWVAALGWGWTLLSGSAALPAASGAAAWAQAWGPLLYLGVFATALTTLLQTLGQRHVSAPVASLIYSLEPVSASVFSFLLIGEKIGPRGLLGGALVVASTVLSSQASGEAHPETPTPDAGRSPEDEDDLDDL